LQDCRWRFSSPSIEIAGPGPFIPKLNNIAAINTWCADFTNNRRGCDSHLSPFWSPVALWWNFFPTTKSVFAEGGLGAGVRMASPTTSM
jgi:hypothetical protein